jgi:hypothetical protein
MLSLRSTALAALLAFLPGAALAAVLGYGAPLAEFAPATQAALAGSGSPASAFYARFLARYLVTDTPDRIHRLRYGAVTAEDRAALEAWVDAEAQRSPRGLARDAQFAYWANLYNALTVVRVLRGYPVTSILDLKRWPWSFGPWDEDLITVQGVALSLNAIEHRVMRPLFNEPRVHFALNCASLGCPNLLPQPFTGENLEAALQGALQAYLAHPRGIAFEDEVLTLSSLFDWYRDDFPPGQDALLAYLAAAAPEALGPSLRAFDGPIAFRYDWALNDAP